MTKVAAQLPLCLALSLPSTRANVPDRTLFLRKDQQRQNASGPTTASSLDLRRTMLTIALYGVPRLSSSLARCWAYSARATNANPSPHAGLPNLDCGKDSWSWHWELDLTASLLHRLRYSCVEDARRHYKGDGLEAVLEEDLRETAQTGASTHTHFRWIHISKTRQEILVQNVIYKPQSSSTRIASPVHRRRSSRNDQEYYHREFTQSSHYHLRAE